MTPSSHSFFSLQSYQRQIIITFLRCCLRGQTEVQIDYVGVDVADVIEDIVVLVMVVAVTSLRVLKVEDNIKKEKRK